MLCPADWTELNSFGDCPILVINVISFLWLTCFAGRTFLVFKRITAAKNNNNNNGLSEPLVEQESVSNAPIYVSNGLILVRALQLISVFQIIISVFLILSAGPGDEYTAYLLNLGLHIVGWLELLAVNSFLLNILSSGIISVFYGCFGWGVLQLMSTGIVCIGLLSSIDDNASLAQIAYFLVSLVSLCIWLFIFFTSESDSPQGEERFFKAGFSFFRRADDVTLTNFVDATDDDTERAVARNDGWEVKGGLTSSTQSSSIWASRGGLGNPLTAKQTKKSDFVDIRLSFDQRSEESTNFSDSFGDRGSRNSRSVDVLRAVDFEGLTINRSAKGPAHMSTGMSTAAVIAGKRGTGALRGQLSYAGDCTISVVDWNFVSINGKVVVVYKLGLGEAAPVKQVESDSAPASRSVRIALKRFDEILYLREKIVSDFPSLLVPPVPTLVFAQSDGSAGSSRNHPDYERHKSEMSDFLEQLITHPIAGPLAMKDLRSSIREREGHRGSIPDGPVVETAVPDSVERSEAPASTESGTVPTLFPLLLGCEGRLEARVNTWTNVEISRKEIKTHYDVEIKLRRSGVGSFGASSSDEIDEDLVWTVRKRYRQFQSLFWALQRTGVLNKGSVPIVLPTKASKRRPAKTLSREYEVKLTENAIALDGFLKACCQLQPLPSLLLAFFESDISTRSCGFDMIMMTPEDAGSAEETERIILMRSNLTSFVERKEKASQVEQTMIGVTNAMKSDVKPLNTCFRASNKRIMFFGSSSRQNEAPAANSMGPDADGDDVDVRLSTDGDDDVVVVMDDGKEIDDENDEDSEFVPTTRESMESREGSIANTTTRSSLNNGQRGAPGISKKASKLPSMFNFMSSSSVPSPARVRTAEEVLALTANPLRDLIAMVRFVQANYVCGPLSCVTPSSASAAAVSTPISFLPGSTTSDDYLTHGEALSLCSVWKAAKSTDSASIPRSTASSTSSANFVNLAPANGIWLSQWRIRRALLCTTAFVDWSENIANLKSLNLRALKLLSNEEKLCFCINLYNLISLHATILMPWPKLTDQVGRIVWMKNAKYQIGSGTVSLLHLEHCLLRANLNNVDLPTFLNTEIPYPLLTELRGLSVLAPSAVVDPRVPFALALPFKSSTSVQVFHPEIMKKVFREVAGRYFIRLVSISRGVLTLPKLLRMNFKDFEDWQCSSHAPIAVPAEPRVSADNGAGEKRGGKALAGSLSPDPRDRRLKRAGQADSIDGAEEKDKSTEWDIAGQDRKYTQPSDFESHRSMLLGKRAGCIGDELLVNSDIVLSEHELQRLVTLLRVGVDVRDRKYRMKTYRSCFLGSDAVRCFLASGDAKTVAQSIAIGDLLIQLGFIEHVTHDYWMKDSDLLYIFSDLVMGTRQMIQCMVRVIDDHVDDMELRRQLAKSMTSDDAVHYGCEDWGYCVPLDK